MEVCGNPGKGKGGDAGSFPAGNRQRGDGNISASGEQTAQSGRKIYGTDHGAGAGGCFYRKPSGEGDSGRIGAVGTDLRDLQYTVCQRLDSEHASGGDGERNRKPLDLRYLLCL